MRFGWWFACVLVVASVAAAAPGNEPRPRAGGGGLVGAPSPSVTASRVAGNDPVDMRSLSGRVVIVDFWATWCGPCQPMMRVLNGMHREFHDRGLTVLGLTTEDRGTIEAYLRRRPVDYTIARDPGHTARRFGVRAMPTLVLVDRRGQVREVFVGVDGPSVSRLHTRVRALLDEAAP